jgi:hypothetical protein
MQGTNIAKKIVYVSFLDTYILEMKHKLILVISNEGWLQGRVVHFLCHNIIFSKVACIYMLLTWHEKNIFPNLWLDLDYQIEEEDIYKKIATYLHQIYSNGLLKLKNMNWFIVYAYIHIDFCL